MTTLDEKTKVPIGVVYAAITACLGLVVGAIPLTLYFASTRAIAEGANTDNAKQEIAIQVCQKDISDIKADIREIKTIFKRRGL